MTEQSRASELSARILPFASRRIFPESWLDAGDDRAQLIEIARKRRAFDGPRPDAVLQTQWGRASTEVAGHRLDLLTPKGGSTGRVLFYCHGGAFVIGPSTIEWLFAAKVAHALSCDLAVYDYPRVPEVDSATILSTTLSAFDTIVERYDSDQITIAGTSAGGGLAVATMLQLHRAGRPLPRACALFSPWVDMTVSHPDAAALAATDQLLRLPQLRRDGELYAGASDVADALISPRFTTGEELAALPPTVVTVGEHEVLRPEGAEFVDNLVAAGSRAHLFLEPHGQHVGIAGPHPEASALFAECVEALARYI